MNEEKLMSVIHQYSAKDIEMVKLIRAWMPPGTGGALVIAKSIYDSMRREGYEIARARGEG